jgi:hypothetical protein
MMKIGVHSRRRGGGNVEISFIDFKVRGKGGKQHYRFPGFP